MQETFISNLHSFVFLDRREREEIGERYRKEKAMDFPIHSLIFNQGYICLCVGYIFITTRTTP